MDELQRSDIALDTCQSSKVDILRMQASSRARRTEYYHRQNERITTTILLEERDRMVRDLSELNEMNRLLIARCQEYEDRDADLEGRSSRERHRYTDQIEHLEQQLEDLRLEYEVANTELQRLQRQQGEATQHEGVVARLTDQVDKMRGDTINQRSALRKELQELRTTLEDRDLRLEELRVMLENRNEDIATMEQRVTHTREARGSLQLRLLIG